ncbi:MAG: methyltransferase [Actinomycetaceae bacterium]|nr:methyltransferase [Actinomycetaceae bacterium]
MNEHYFSPHPSAEERYSREVSICGNTYHVSTSAGVFSAGGLDKATAVFLDRVPLDTLPEDARVLDLGCGWGPLSLALAQTYPHAELWATDTNTQALSLTRENLQNAGFTGNVCTPEEAFAKLTPASVDLIWSNPPIRIGKAALHELLLDNLRLLKPDGNAYFVVGKNLGADSLTVWLREQGYGCEKIGSSKGFRILHVCPR